MKSKPGTYILVLKSHSSVCVEIGRWGSLDVRPGYYLYAGSAFGPGGVFARVARHCRKVKSKHWHIDYLLEHASLVSVWYNHSRSRLEHQWAKALTKMKDTSPVIGFGCSDCTCASHLVFATVKPDFAAFAKIVQRTVKLWPFENMQGLCMT